MADGAVGGRSARPAVRGDPVTFVAPAVSVRGAVAVPGDKSISHRAVLLGAICDGETVVRGFGRSADTESTVRAVRALGVQVEEEDDDVLRIQGVGLQGLRAADGPIDCGNAGTLVRLLAGILAGQTWRQFEATTPSGCFAPRVSGSVLGRAGSASRRRSDSAWARSTCRATSPRRRRSCSPPRCFRDRT